MSEKRAIFLGNPIVDGDQVIFITPDIGGPINVDGVTAGDSKLYCHNLPKPLGEIWTSLPLSKIKASLLFKNGQTWTDKPDDPIDGANWIDNNLYVDLDTDTDTETETETE